VFAKKLLLKEEAANSFGPDSSCITNCKNTKCFVCKLLKWFYMDNVLKTLTCRWCCFLCNDFSGS